MGCVSARRVGHSRPPSAPTSPRRSVRATGYSRWCAHAATFSSAAARMRPPERPRAPPSARARNLSFPAASVRALDCLRHGALFARVLPALLGLRCAHISCRRSSAGLRFSTTPCSSPSSPPPTTAARAATRAACSSSTSRCEGCARGRGTGSSAHLVNPRRAGPRL